MENEVHRAMAVIDAETGIIELQAVTQTPKVQRKMEDFVSK